MMNDEHFRKSLIEITDSGLLNAFINEIFGYNLKDEQYIYIQYKIVHNNIILNMFDNSDSNRFKAFIFTQNSNLKDSKDIKYIDINLCYNNYKKKKIQDKLCLIGALLATKKNNEKKDIINKLFDDNIAKILLKYFIAK